MRQIGAAQEDVNAVLTKIQKLENDVDAIIKSAEDAVKSAFYDYVDAMADVLDAQMEDELSVLQAQLDALEAQRDAAKERRDEEEKLLAVEKARVALENAQRERTVRQYNSAAGQWEWVANAKTVEDAEKALIDAETALEEYRAEKDYEAKKTALELEIQSTKEAFAAQKKAWTDAAALVRTGALSVEQALKRGASGVTTTTADLKSALTASKSSLDSAINSLRSVIAAGAVNVSATTDDLRSVMQSYTGSVSDGLSALANVLNSGAVEIGDALQAFRETIQAAQTLLEETVAGYTETGVPIYSDGGGGTYIQGKDGTKFPLNDWSKDSNDYSARAYSATSAAELETWLSKRALKAEAQGVDISGVGAYKSNDQIRAEWYAANGIASSSGGSGHYDAHGNYVRTNSSGNLEVSSTIYAIGNAAMHAMSDRNTDHAGQTVYNSATGYNVTYDDRGYVTKTAKVNDDGGLLKGMGHIKLTPEDELVLPPDLTKTVLESALDGSTARALDKMRVMYGMKPAQSTTLAHGNTYADSGTRIGTQYVVNGMTISEDSAKYLTVEQAVRFLRGANNLPLHYRS